MAYEETAPYPKQAPGTPPAAAPALPPHEAEALRQLRVLEDRFVNLRRRAQLTDENLLSSEQKLADELRVLTQELTDARRTLAELEQSMKMLQGEMEHTASIYDLKALEKYLGFWEPLQFVTQTELTRRRNLLKEPPGRLP